MKIELELIPVSERLPDKAVRCFVFTGMGPYVTIGSREDGGWERWDDDHPLINVIAWAELPTLNEDQLRQLTMTPEEVLEEEIAVAVQAFDGAEIGGVRRMIDRFQDAVIRYQRAIGRVE